MTLPTIDQHAYHNVPDARDHLQKLRDQHFHEVKMKHTFIAAGAAAVPVALLLTGLLDFGVNHQPLGAILIVACLACLVYAIMSLVRRHRALQQEGRTVFLQQVNAHDPQNALGAIDEMIASLKTRSPSMQKLADAAIQRLQALRPDTPLSHLQRYGYYPSRPVETRNDRQYTINNDEDAYEEHWQRMCVALDDLRAKLRGRVVLTETEIDYTMSRLVPPMRTVMRASGIDTARIEYLPAHHAPQPVAKKGKKGKNKEIAADDATPAPALPAPADTAPTVHEPDALTPVEGMLNASATMTAASLRSLMLSFRKADDGLFLGDDQTTGELVIERHLPALVTAYRIAHEAATGDDRDQVRADFAHALKTLRDTLEGVMAGHVKAARQLLQDQGRFIDSRHVDGDLSPVGGEGRS